MAKNLIYLDNAATTPMRPEVLDAMLPYFKYQYGNPSAIYSLGQDAQGAVRKARQIIAKSLGPEGTVLPSEIQFTSGGTESDNWAIQKVADCYIQKGKHIITTKIEHHAVLNTLAYLEGMGYDVTYLDVDSEGSVNPYDVERAIRPDTILISVMFANNEIGTIEPIAKIGKIAKEHGVLFHTDAVQAYGHIPINVNDCNIDLMSTSAHKLNGPKGVGFLYVRKGVDLKPLIYGGGQEHGLRSGTENVPGIVGFGKAVELAMKDMDKRRETMQSMRDYMINGILSGVSGARLNGSRTHRLPNNMNFSFRGVESESLLTLLDDSGICCSAGSACSSGSLEASHVLTSIGLTEELARQSLRLTIGEDMTKEIANNVISILIRLIRKLRDASPKR